MLDDYTRHQQGIIKRYYRNLDKIQLQRLSELVTELCLADGKKRDKLWESAAAAMKKLEVPPQRVTHLVQKKDPAPGGRTRQGADGVVDPGSPCPRPAAPDAKTPACFATVPTGLEAVAADEITRDLGGDVKKAEKGVVVFRVPEIGPDLLRCAPWTTCSSSPGGPTRSPTRPRTSRDPPVDGPRGRLAAPPRPAPRHPAEAEGRSRPTAWSPRWAGRTATGASTPARRWPRASAACSRASWKPAEENASVEVWLIIRGRTAVCGVRLSDKTMRHRTYKVEHQPASLRPTIAAAMVRLAGAGPGDVVLDPMCGAGTILAEQIELSKVRKAGRRGDAGAATAT